MDSDSWPCWTSFARMGLLFFGSSWLHNLTHFFMGAPLHRFKRHRARTPRTPRGGQWAAAQVLSLSLLLLVFFVPLLFLQNLKKNQTRFQIWRINLVFWTNSKFEQNFKIEFFNFEQNFNFKQIWILNKISKFNQIRNLKNLKSEQNLKSEHIWKLNNFMSKQKLGLKVKNKKRKQNKNIKEKRKRKRLRLNGPGPARNPAGVASVRGRRCIGGVLYPAPCGRGTPVCRC
jgi:hypothetical protein